MIPIFGWSDSQPNVLGPVLETDHIRVPLFRGDQFVGVVCVEVYPKEISCPIEGHEPSCMMEFKTTTPSSPFRLGVGVNKEVYEALKENETK